MLEIHVSNEWMSQLPPLERTHHPDVAPGPGVSLLFSRQGNSTHFTVFVVPEFQSVTKDLVPCEWKFETLSSKD